MMLSYSLQPLGFKDSLYLLNLDFESDPSSASIRGYNWYGLRQTIEFSMHNETSDYRLWLMLDKEHILRSYA